MQPALRGRNRRAEHVHLHLQAVLAQVELVERDLGHHARHVVQFVDRAELLFDAREQRLRGVEVGAVVHVGAGGFTTEHVVDGRHGRAEFFLAAREHRHLAALGGEAPRHRQADAGRSANHDAGAGASGHAQRRRPAATECNARPVAPARPPRRCRRCGGAASCRRCEPRCWACWPP
jgi:hypothetical protein